jgi:hypothetical protein
MVNPIGGVTDISVPSFRGTCCLTFRIALG